VGRRSRTNQLDFGDDPDHDPNPGIFKRFFDEFLEDGAGQGTLNPDPGFL